MPGDKADVVMFGPKPIIEDVLSKAPGLQLHKAWAVPDHDAYVAKIAPTVRGIAAAGGHGRIDGAITEGKSLCICEHECDPFGDAGVNGLLPGASQQRLRQIERDDVMASEGQLDCHAPGT